MGAAVVWCNKCKTAVWAYDALSGREDVRGLMNMMNMPCPECGETSNFDGWNSYGQELEDLISSLKHATSEPIYDWWSALKAIFKTNCKDGKWAISPDCKWFRRPDGTAETDEYPDGMTSRISELIREHFNNNASVRALRGEHERRTM